VAAEESLNAPTGDPERFADAYADVRGDASIQFEMNGIEPPAPPPAWLEWLIDGLAGTGPVFSFLFWVAVAAGVLFILYLIFRWAEGRGLSFRRKPREKAGPEQEAWAIAEAPARALLAEADALAAAGRYSEAAHLLLFRSIEEIDRRRAAVIRPALTSRDIAAAPGLPPEPRGAFQRIVMMVERSLFGGAQLAAADWQSCRADYEQFAFAKAWK
jgi:hypothetical protein